MMSIFPNCVVNVRVQALSCDLTTSEEQSLNDRNKIANERQVNNCDLRIDQDMCTFALCTCKCMYIPEFFENFKGGVRPPRPPLPSKSASDKHTLFAR